ncbi:hypothetical protein [Streptomyces pilosus]|uniref:Uncharacterized protein n=1 Tax=Streptomyces pilosus TaxID=28893 RepID=A0A918BX14_9ACTN|nr:hypothetical protein [Streptomyces pilosus]GGQ94838.1 hypothetical protein GCM10010280_48040 [Streptomyces pilosus]GGV47719.1 hypothetical protein GCM10010261_23980 [Streptomyces pilosus]
MTAQSPDAGGSPDEHDGVPSVPEDVWQRFLTDTEHAIRATAPKEPPAYRRTAGTGAGIPLEDDGAPAPVGDLWCPDDPWQGPAWRDLDRGGKLRRTGRVAGTAAAIALALGAWSLLSTGGGTPVEGPGGDTVLQQSEVAPADVPTGVPEPSGPVTPSPSGPAVQAG